MFLLYARTPMPDLPYWPGRRLLATLDAVAWPVAWLVVIAQFAHPTGIAGAVAVALLMLFAMRRVFVALWRNHRYQFATLRWGRAAVFLLAFGLIVQFVLTR